MCPGCSLEPRPWVASLLRSLSPGLEEEVKDLGVWWPRDLMSWPKLVSVCVTKKGTPRQPNDSVTPTLQCMIQN